MRYFSENSQECWVRIGEQVMCGSVYSYILAIRHYAPNILGTPKFAKLTHIGEYCSENQFLLLYVKFMREHPRMKMNNRYSPILTYSWRTDLCVVPA